MALSWTSLGTRYTSTDASAFALTASRAASAGEILWAYCINRINGGTATTACTASGMGGSWSLASTQEYDTAGDRLRLDVFTSAPSSPSGTVITFTMPYTAAGIAAGALAMSGSALTGSNGLACIAASAVGPTNTSATAVTADVGATLQGAAALAVFTHQALEGTTTEGELNDISGASDWAIAAGTATDRTATASWASNVKYTWAIFDIATLTALAASGSITPTGALTTLAQYARAAAGAITPNGALTTARSIVQSMAGAIAPSGALLKSASKFFSGSITPVGAAARAKVRRLLRALTGGTLSLTEETENTLALTAEEDILGEQFTALTEEDA